MISPDVVRAIYLADVAERERDQARRAWVAVTQPTTGPRFGRLRSLVSRVSVPRPGESEAASLSGVVPNLSDYPFRTGA